MCHGTLFSEDGADFVLVAFDEVEVAILEEGFDCVASNVGGACADGIEEDGATDFVVGFYGGDVVRDAVGCDGSHVDYESAAEFGEVGGFFAVIGHDGAGADAEGNVGGEVLDDEIGHVVA